MSSNDANSNESLAAKRSVSYWPVAVVALGIAAIGAGLIVFQSIRRAPAELLDRGSEAVEQLTGLMRAFREGRVTTSFLSYATEVSGNNHLQFATLREVEVFERTDSATVLWGQLQLPDVVVSAQAPVVYTYILDLNGRWEITLDRGGIQVIAPPIEHNPPAIDLSAMRYDVRSGSVFRDEQDALARLRLGITELANRRAAENTELVRELGRRKTEEFVRNWLLNTYPDSESKRVDVVFADELPAGKTAPASRELEPIP